VFAHGILIEYAARHRPKRNRQRAAAFILELVDIRGLYYAMWRQQIGERELAGANGLIGEEQNL
jgi:hypothetical protein